MKKLLITSIIPILILSGCGAKSNQIQKPQTQQSQDQDDEEMSWFEDEVLDLDDWGESKHKKVKPKTNTSTSNVTKPSTNSKSSTVKSKTATTKKNS